MKRLKRYQIKEKASHIFDTMHGSYAILQYYNRREVWTLRPDGYYHLHAKVEYDRRKKARKGKKG